MCQAPAELRIHPQVLTPLDNHVDFVESNSGRYARMIGNGDEQDSSIFSDADIDTSNMEDMMRRQALRRESFENRASMHRSIDALDVSDLLDHFDIDEYSSNMRDIVPHSSEHYQQQHGEGEHGADMYLCYTPLALPICDDDGDHELESPPSTSSSVPDIDSFDAARIKSNTRRWTQSKMFQMRRRDGGRPARRHPFEASRMPTRTGYTPYHPARPSFPVSHSHAQAQHQSHIGMMHNKTSRGPLLQIPLLAAPFQRAGFVRDMHAGVAPYPMHHHQPMYRAPVVPF